MGKDWLYRGGGGGNGGGGRSKSSGRSGGGGGGESGGVVGTPSAAGCMSAVFQLFDLHKFQFSLHHHPHQQEEVPSFLPEEPTVLKGVEAPRNSLEVEEPFMEVATSFPSAMKEEEALDIPMGIQIRTSGAIGRSKQDLCSECRSSPAGIKTPSLVARLMGLDLLPHDHISSPPSSHRLTSNPPPNQRRPSDRTSRSLPETPRTSSARKSDFDYHHRLSLQFNKENVGFGGELQLISGYAISSIKTGRRREVREDDERENRSPGQCARQIVKQAKESVLSRKVGTDITNRVRNRDENRDDHVVLLKAKKETDFRSHSGQSLSNPKSQSKSKEQKCHQKGEKIMSGHFRRHSTVIQNKREEPFVHSSIENRAKMSAKKCKKIVALSSELLINHSNVPTLFPVKKDTSSSPTRNLPQKQVSDAISSKRSTQLPSRSSQTYTLTTTQGGGSSSNGGGGAAEFQHYVTSILKRMAVDKNSPLSLTAKWYSPSHPLDPLIFHHLELSSFTTTTVSTVNGSRLSQRCNRKLIFDLVDEILVENLRPSVLSPIIHCDQMNGTQLVDTICSKIRSFPEADCKVLEDIDMLIDRDLKRSELQGSMVTEEEGEAIAAEIEGDIVETLVHELGMVLFWT